MSAKATRVLESVSELEFGRHAQDHYGDLVFVLPGAIFEDALAN